MLIRAKSFPTRELRSTAMMLSWRRRDGKVAERSSAFQIRDRQLIWSARWFPCWKVSSIIDFRWNRNRLRTLLVRMACFPPVTVDRNSLDGYRGKKIWNVWNPGPPILSPVVSASMEDQPPSVVAYVQENGLPRAQSGAWTAKGICWDDEEFSMPDMFHIPAI